MAFLDILSLIGFTLAFMLTKLTGKIVVFTVHDLYDFGKKSFRRKLLIEVARNIVFRFANSIHAHNHFTRELIRSRYKRKTNIFVIPHGNFIGYYSNQISRSDARQQLELPNDTLSRLDQISAHFEDLKRYLKEYEIETALAKDLLERMNLIMILQNRIRDHLCKYI